MPSDNPSNHRTRFKATKNLSATPVSVKLPRHIDEIVRTIPNRSQWLTDAIVDKLKKEGLTLDGLYLRERLDQGQVPIAEIIQRGRSEQVENGMEVARVTQPQSAEGESLRAYYQMARSSPAISLSELRAMCDRHLNPFRDGQELHARSQSTGRIIEFIAIATPNGLKWQYQGAVIID